jgi:hypothetical protein
MELRVGSAATPARVAAAARLLADMVKTAAPNLADESTYRGSMVVHSRIHRIGRADDGKHLTVRIFIGDGNHEVRLVAEDVDPFYEAAKTGAPCALRVDGAWLRGDDGALRLAPSKCRVTALDLAPARSGAEFLDSVDKAGIFVDADPEETLRHALGEA